jgi:Ni,Fe-hydrogenase maturation factor
MKKKIYIFGNLLLDFDNNPLLIQPELSKIFFDIEFIIQDPNENLHPDNKELVIIDTVEDIKEVKILTDIEQIQFEPKYSMHDFDLGFNLKLLHKIGHLEKVTIFCVPMFISKQAALEQLVMKISKFYSLSL